MGFPAINGGILLLALVVFWLFLFRPNREKSSKTNLSGETAFAPRNRSITKRITGWSSLATFAIAVSSFFFVNQTDDAWIVPAAFGGITVVLFATNLAVDRFSRVKRIGRSASRQSNKGLRATDVQSFMDARKQILDEESQLVSAREWQPQALPDQLYRSDVGTLEQAVLAEVVSIDEVARDASAKYGVNIDENVDATRINLDEILRRRRANGN